MQEKQPVIQSVFDRRMLEKDDIFFSRAITELEGYHRDLLLYDARSTEHKQLVQTKNHGEEALSEIFAGLAAATGMLRGVYNSFDVLTDDGYF